MTKTSPWDIFSIICCSLCVVVWIVGGVILSIKNNNAGYMLDAAFGGLGWFLAGIEKFKSMTGLRQLENYVLSKK